MSGKLADWSDRLIVTDGGWSTILTQRGLPRGMPAELAGVREPKLVQALAREYLAAGAQILTTNTFAANRIAAAARGIDVDLAALNREATRLLRRIAPAQVRVAGCIGPTGRIVSIGEVSDDDLKSAYAEQAAALAEGGADLLVLETFSDMKEVVAVLEAVRSAVELPIVASLSFDSGAQRTQTMMGVEAAECPARLEQAGADAVGMNCGVGAGPALPAVVALRGNTRLPLWVRPSAGLPDLVQGRPVYSQTPEDFAVHVQKLIEAGAQVVGGCCGVGPAHIQRLAAQARARERKT